MSHFGDIKLAMELLDMSIEAGADAFKIQLFDVDFLYANNKDGWKDRLRPRNLTLDEALLLKEVCNEHQMAFLATAHDESRIPWLEELDVPAIKVGSGEKGNFSFIKKLIQLNKPMIVSTGMYSSSEVSALLSLCELAACKDLALMHCVTAYPTPAEQVNLLSIQALGRLFSGPVGYSDHTENGLAIQSAVALGANLVERHITILKNVPNAQDWRVASDPDEFKMLVKNIRQIEKMLGSEKKEQVSCEKDAVVWALKSLVAARNLPASHVVVTDDLVAKRPGSGLPPNQIDKIVGKKLNRAIKKNERVDLEDVS